MKYALALVLFSLLLQGGSAVAAPPRQIAALDWLTGKTWTAKPAGIGDVARIDTRYEWSSTGNFVRFDTQFVEGDGSVNQRYAGMFFVDPKDGPSVWYMHQDDTITNGTVNVRPDGMTMNISQADGTYRVDVLRTSRNSYRWDLFQRQRGSWAKALTLDFVTAS